MNLVYHEYRYFKLKTIRIYIEDTKYDGLIVNYKLTIQTVCVWTYYMIVFYVIVYSCPHETTPRKRHRAAYISLLEKSSTLEIKFTVSIILLPHCLPEIQ